jgi:hypothetical protein
MDPVIHAQKLFELWQKDSNYYHLTEALDTLVEALDDSPENSRAVNLKSTLCKSLRIELRKLFASYNIKEIADKSKENFANIVDGTLSPDEIERTASLLATIHEYCDKDINLAKILLQE